MALLPILYKAVLQANFALRCNSFKLIPSLYNSICSSVLLSHEGHDSSSSSLEVIDQLILDVIRHDIVGDHYRASILVVTQRTLIIIVHAIRPRPVATSSSSFLIGRTRS